ncbi:MAG: hypothetical protein EOP04_01090 [Proteobacteria bacterium]|nr:MAG: hypothetical protein EOP04_01090 [Pseudomonadota bacterium]
MEILMFEMNHLATILFACSIIHIFCTKKILSLSHRFPNGSIQENSLHFLGEVEVVFGLWAAVFMAIWSIRFGTKSASAYLDSVNYTEAIFVFVIMCMAATRPILQFSDLAISTISRILPVKPKMALYVCCMILGPLLGSLITEPAAMTVTALLLRDLFFKKSSSQRFLYVSIGLLFVNISIGGTLTHFAAPPVLMVAGPWKWDSYFMLTHFGWRAVVAILVSTVATAIVFREELSRDLERQSDETKKTPLWVLGVHLAFMVLTIATAHHVSFFVPVFLLFLGWCSVSSEYQDDIKIKESLLVGFFLAGLVTLGKLQEWWLQPLLSGLGETPLFWGAMSLTAFTDNAALTYLGTLVPGLSDSAKYALVAGAVTGGGLTVIANAPNPAGFGILRQSFGEDGVNPIGLFLAALPFTLVAALAFLL